MNKAGQTSDALQYNDPHGLMGIVVNYIPDLQSEFKRSKHAFNFFILAECVNKMEILQYLDFN